MRSFFRDGFHQWVSQTLVLLSVGHGRRLSHARAALGVSEGVG